MQGRAEAMQQSRLPANRYDAPECSVFMWRTLQPSNHYRKAYTYLFTMRACSGNFPVPKLRCWEKGPVIRTGRQTTVSASLSHPLLSGASPRSRENTKYLFTKTLALSFAEAAYPWHDPYPLCRLFSWIGILLTLSLMSPRQLNSLSQLWLDCSMTFSSSHWLHWNRRLNIGTSSHISQVFLCSQTCYH